MNRESQGGVESTEAGGLLPGRGAWGVEQDDSASAAWRRRALEWARREWNAGIRERFAGKWKRG